MYTIYIYIISYFQIPSFYPSPSFSGCWFLSRVKRLVACQRRKRRQSLCTFPPLNKRQEKATLPSHYAKKDYSKKKDNLSRSFST